MSFEQKDGQGALFKNEKKQKDTHPDYNGSIRINGQEFWLDAWLKESKSGKKYMSLSAKPKMAQEHAGGTPNPPAQKGASFESDVPF